MKNTILKVNSWIENLKDLFRKKEYYVIDYKSLNNYSIEFNEIDEEDIKKIKEVILDFPDAESVANNKANLFLEQTIKLLDIENLLVQIKEIVLSDYKETYFEAIKENWTFNYFLSFPQKIYNNTLLVSVRIKHNSGTIGDVIYPLLAVRKYSGCYYLWNLLEKNE